MNRRMFIQVAAPAAVIGLVLSGICLYCAWQVQRLQADLSDILDNSMRSLQAAQQLETHVETLRFQSLLLLVDPGPNVQRTVELHQQLFEEWLEHAAKVAHTPEELATIQEMRAGYQRFLREMAEMRIVLDKLGPPDSLSKLADALPIKHITDPCNEFARINQAHLEDTVEESARVTRWLQAAMLLLGLGGPLGGLLSGFGIARALSRSLHKLSLRVHDMAQHLEKDVAAVKFQADGDLVHLDRQLDHVMMRVAEVMQELHKQQREIQRSQQLAAAGQLAAGVAHEVRNPLTSIKMLVEAGLRAHKPRPLSIENLQVMHGEILRLEQTVQSFLDFARPPALQKVASDIRYIVHQAVELTKVRARQQNVGVEVRLPEREVLAPVDKSQLGTVLVNLLINALDAMPSGGSLRVELAPEGSDGFRLHVADTGGGLAPAILDKLFSPFVSTKPTGSGLGLSICRRIMEEHGGAIQADNQPDGGACFTLVLPAAS
ncbi:MAG: ATP-binding protein [Gemmataceae bacterium]|nr:ATP-binding protein [Gemmataceae bacterium]MCI0739204.1 ATP-binding protein [Gemmataceae bacterium]